MAEMLNPDCLEMVFLKLPEPDLINAARVCTIWRDVSARMIKSVNFADFFEPTGDPQQTLNIMKDILKCCGESFVDISVSFVAVSHPPNILDVISSYCPKLSHFKLADTHVTESGMNSLIERCPNLQWLAFSNIQGHFDFELVQLLRNCRTIVGLRLTSIEWFTGRSLSQLRTEKFNALEVTFCERFNLSYLRSANMLNKQLKYFSLRDSRQCLPDLSALTLMTNLIQLEVYTCCEEMDDEWMLEISQRCKFIEKLVLVIGNLVTDDGLDAILDLPMLQKLELADPCCISRGLWGQRCIDLQLKSLHLINFKLTDLEIFNVITVAPELEELILDDCELPEETELLSALGRSVLERHDDIIVPLKLLVQRSCGRRAFTVTFDKEYLMVLKEAGLINTRRRRVVY